MNLKSKIVTVVAAGLLGLGIAGGPALAADITTNPNVTLTLNGGTTTCTVSAQTATLGTYNWNGSQYVLDQSNAGIITLQVAISEAYGATGDTCDVSAAVGVISGPGGQQFNVPINLSSAQAGANFHNAIPLATTGATPPVAPSDLADAVANGTYSWNVGAFSDSILRTYAAGTYTGTLQLTGHVTGQP